MKGLFQKQIIQGEEMFSKNFKILFFLFFFIITLSKILNAKEENIARVLKYVDELNNLSDEYPEICENMYQDLLKVCYSFNEHQIAEQFINKQINEISSKK